MLRVECVVWLLAPPAARHVWGLEWTWWEIGVGLSDKQWEQRQKQAKLRAAKETAEGKNNSTKKPLKTPKNVLSLCRNDDVSLKHIIMLIMFIGNYTGIGKF